MLRRALSTLVIVFAAGAPILTGAVTGSVAGAATDPTNPLVGSKGASCLAGTWSLVLPNSPAGLAGNSTTSEGSVTLQFGPGRKMVETFASAITTGQPGPGGVYLQTRQEVTGTLKANWSATLHKLTLTRVRNDTTAVSTVQIDERSSDPATESPAPQTFKAKKQTIGYTCSGDALRLASVGGLDQGFTRTG